VTGPIKVSIRIDGEDDQAAGSLYRWLTLDPQVRRDTMVSIVSAPPGAGEMGGSLEAIDVLIGNGLAIGSLLLAISSWRTSRPRPPTIRIERDGVSITIEDASPETVRRIVDALTDRPADPGEGEGDGPI
jgi:hypothetical protein